MGINRKINGTCIFTNTVAKRACLKQNEKPIGKCLKQSEKVGVGGTASLSPPHRTQNMKWKLEVYGF